MIRFIKFGWYLSILFFLLILLWIYAYLPGNVGYHANDFGLPDKFISKETLFYVMLGLFIFTNVVIYSLYKLIQLQYLKSPSGPVKQLNTLPNDLSLWLLGFTTAINIFYILGLIYLSVFNNQEGITISHYAPVVFAGPVLIGLMLAILAYIFLKKRK